MFYSLIYHSAKETFILLYLSGTGWFPCSYYTIQVKEVYLSTEHLTVENGLLTPTLKSKRPAVRERYKTQMQDMYNQNSVNLSTEHLTVENGLLTPTLKSKRPAVRERYKTQMQDMYNQNSVNAKWETHVYNNWNADLFQSFM